MCVYEFIHVCMCMHLGVCIHTCWDKRITYMSWFYPFITWVLGANSDWHQMPFNHWIVLMTGQTSVKVLQGSMVTQCFLALTYLKNTGCLFSTLCLGLGLFGVLPLGGCSLCFGSHITEVIWYQLLHFIRGCMMWTVPPTDFNTWLEWLLPVSLCGC